MMMKTTVVACAFLAIGCSEGGGTIEPTGPVALGRVLVNEVVSHNASSAEDEGGAFPDWIELYNPGDADYSVAGHWISDDAADPMRHELPVDTPPVPAGGWLLLWADDDEEEGPLHLSFGISSAGGDDVVLSGPSADGAPLIDEVDDLPPAEVDHSWARTPDGGQDWQDDATPTPLAENVP